MLSHDLYSPKFAPGASDVLTVSIVIPALNEEKNVPHVVRGIPHDVHQVILVDGGSTDRTVEVALAHRPSIIVMRQTRTGKGNALACGFEACTGDVVVMMDADGSTDSAEIPSFVAALRDGADYSKGSRFRSGGGSDDITRLRRAGNRALNGLVNALFGTRFSDLCYGFNAVRRDHLAVLELPPTNAPALPGGRKIWGDGFEIETLMNLRIATAGLRITEVPSAERRRMYGSSNLNAVTDGLRVLRTILHERFRRPVRAVP